MPRQNGPVSQSSPECALAKAPANAEWQTELMHRLAAVERERAHRLVRDFERPLELRLDGQQPVEVI